MSLKSVLQFKVNRGEYKDQIDVVMIINNMFARSVDNPKVPMIPLKRKIKSKVVRVLKDFLPDSVFNKIRLLYKEFNA